MTSLTRTYRFPASHRLHLPHLSELQNAALFGKCNNPFGHGHDYSLDVTVEGNVDRTTGLILSLRTLDDLVGEVVLRDFSHRNLNLDLPCFAELIPTTENVAQVIWQRLNEGWRTWFPQKTTAHLLKIGVRETDRNSFEVCRSLVQPRSRLTRYLESVPAHV